MRAVRWKNLRATDGNPVQMRSSASQVTVSCLYVTGMFQPLSARSENERC